MGTHGRKVQVHGSHGSMSGSHMYLGRRCCDCVSQPDDIAYYFRIEHGFVTGKPQRVVSQTQTTLAPNRYCEPPLVVSDENRSVELDLSTSLGSCSLSLQIYD